MDLKYISPNKLLMFYGVIGTLICLIICIVSTFIKCSISIEDPKSSFSYYICKVKDTSKTNISASDNYMESFSIYFSNFKGVEILAELARILLGMIAFFFNKYFY
mgnify:FL=1